MHYWIHRCAYMGGHEILDKENRLTIGFSACAKHQKMVEVIQHKRDDEFDAVYETVYGGDVWRGRWSLWYFTREMEAGDIVIVPRVGGFNICKLKGEPQLSDRRNDCDIGWEWDVEILAKCFPREQYAPTGLLSRMKCRQTTLNIGELAEEVEDALRRYQTKKPFALMDELAEKCHRLLDKYGSPDHFERLILEYFTKLGAQAEILPKNETGKVGDCDVMAVFPLLRLTISVQAKKHWGETDAWAIRQISEYSDAQTADENWSYVSWVVSFADDFSDEAKQLAKEKNVVLFNGKDFCRMLVLNGVGGSC